MRTLRLLFKLFCTPFVAFFVGLVIAWELFKCAEYDIGDEA